MGDIVEKDIVTEDILMEDIIQIALGELEFDPDALKAKYLAERDKRLRDDANEQYIEVAGDFSNYVDDPYAETVARAPLNDTVEVVIIGGGFGGLLLGGRLREAGFEDIRVIEKGGDFGGTWYWNRYPGAMCDVEAYCYLPMLEELDYIPQHKYSFAPEIMAHTQNIAKHYNLYANACLSTEVTDLAWDEAAQYWTVSTNRGDRMRARYVAMANGPLNRPKLPGIAGIDKFAGHTFHTSRWDYAYTGGDASGGLVNLKNKRVGIIGTGATAVQCIPHLGEWAAELKVFQRTPSSVDVRNNRATEAGWADTFETGWQSRRMDNFNILVSGGDQDQDLVADGWTDIMRNLTGVAAKNAARQIGRRLTSKEKGQLMQMADYQKMNAVRARVDSIVEDEATAAALKPWYRQFCKRPCFHDEYLATFNRENVHLIDTQGKGVEAITERGVVVDGVEHELDCLIFATGFEVGTSYTRRAGYDISGRGGRKLSDKWADGLRTLHGFTTNGFPNCFFLGFTQAALTVNVPHALNEQAKHIAHLLGEARSRQKPVVEATPEGEQSWLDEVKSKANVGVRFRSECTPGYYNNEGKLANPNGFFTSAYGGGPIKYFRILEDWRNNGDFAGVSFRD